MLIFKSAQTFSLSPLLALYSCRRIDIIILETQETADKVKQFAGGPLG